MKIKKDIIAIVGLGYVGLPIAIEFGKQYKTIAFDISKDKIKSYKKNIDVNNEINSSQFKKSKFINFTFSEENLSQADIIIIAVPTPIDSAKKPDLTYLKLSSSTVARNMKKKCTIVYESTVYPGATEEYCIPILEKESGYKWKEDFFVGYSPERINPGDKDKTLTDIIKVVSGDLNKTKNKISKLYKTIIKAGVFEAESIKVAEAAKVIENTQRDINIALMNELSLIFNKMNINTSAVLKAAETKWNFQPFKPGLVGGHCIGIDPYYLLYKASKLGIHTEIIQSGRKINDYMSKYISDVVKESIIKKNITFSKSRVMILGLTFKENVSDTRNSKMIEIYQNLNSKGVKIYCCDPYVNSKEVYREHKIKITDLDKMHKKVDAIIYGVSHNKFKKLKTEYFKKFLKSDGTIYDIQSNLNYKLTVKAGIKIWQL